MAINSPSASGTENMQDNLLSQAREKAAPAVDRMREGMNNASEAIMHGLEDFGELQERWTEECRGCVREHPLASVAVGVAAGLIIGRLLAR